MEIIPLDHESPHRLCPVHRQPTRAAIFSDSTGVSLVWECSACLGYWEESYFLLRVWASLPLLRHQQTARWRCPTCSSPRCESACNHECLCGRHACVECGQDFFIDWHLTRPTTLDPEQIRQLADQRWSEFGLCGTPGNLVDRGPLTYSAIVPAVPVHLECLTCHSSDSEHYDVEHNLVWAPKALSELDRYAWRCLGCDQVVRMGSLAGMPSNLFKSSTPDLRCRVCHHANLEQSNDLTSITCLTCGAQFTLASTLGNATIRS